MDGVDGGWGYKGFLVWASPEATVSGLERDRWVEEVKRPAYKSEELLHAPIKSFILVVILSHNTEFASRDLTLPNLSPISSVSASNLSISYLERLFQCELGITKHSAPGGRVVPR